MLMPNSGRFVRLCVVRLCVRLTILNLFKVYMNLSLRFFCFKFFKVLKQIMYLWFKWIMERCYPHLRWYFSFLKQVLLPLWNFAVEDVVGLEVTQLQWSSKYLGKTIDQDIRKAFQLICILDCACS